MIPLKYKEFELEKQFRVDIVAEQEILMEIKSAEEMLLVHRSQIISYLKHSEKKLGFLVNFNVPIVKKGFKRFVNNF